MKILIADDESLARFNLNYLLRQIIPDAEIEEVEDGEALVEAVRRQLPDLVLVDIEMPRMDGLSAIARLAIEVPQTRFVLATAHTDFEFARRGIDLKVSGYLVKPVELESLERLVRFVEADIDADAAKAASEVEHDLNARLHNAVLGRPSTSTIAEPGGAEYVAAVVWRDATRPAAVSIAAPWWKPLSDALSSTSTVAWCPVSETATAFLLQVRPGGDIAVRAEVDDVCRRLSAPDAMVSALWVHEATTGRALDRLAPALRHRSSRLVGRPGACWPAPEWLDSADDPRVQFTVAFDDALSAGVAGDETRFVAAVSQMKERFGRPPVGLFEGELAQFASVVLGQAIEVGRNDLFAALVSASEQIGRLAAPRAASRIRRVQEYIHEHHAEQLSLTGVAKRFDVSTNYLSAVFHEKTGSTFLHYLTQVRITEATHSLQADPDVPIKDLAAAVGFGSARHFSQVFQRATGQRPSEYAQSQRNRGASDD